MTVTRCGAENPGVLPKGAYKCHPHAEPNVALPLLVRRPPRDEKARGLHPPVRCREGCDVEKSYDSRPSKKLGLQLNFQWIPFRRTVEHLLLLRLGVTTREGPEVGCRWGTEMLPTTRTNPLWANTKQPCRVSPLKHLLKWPLSQNCRRSRHGREGRLAEGHPYNLEHRHGAHDRV